MRDTEGPLARFGYGALGIAIGLFFLGWVGLLAYAIAAEAGLLALAFVALVAWVVRENR